MIQPTMTMMVVMVAQPVIMQNLLCFLIFRERHHFGGSFCHR